MYVHISGFLLDSSEDDSLKFELLLNQSYAERIAQLLGHRNLNAMAAGEWRLTSDQVTQLSSLIGQPLPTDLKLLIGLVA
ncbi:pyocin S6 family toxin immunity protein [Pseudomonas sp. Pseusp122]|uniref:pyocin S6 family toxin immunity protein n=1 Tax=unclassified Pseudomonas TaxID=196821 RepID=UPI0039A726A9